MPPITIVLADDHTLVREGIRSLLEGQSDIAVVGEASDGREAVALARALRPDIVIMDIAMPGLGGIEATRQIRRELPSVRVVILSMYDNEEYITQVFQAGATGYVLKRAAATDLVTCLRVVHQGDVFLHPTIASRVIKDYLHRLNSTDADHPEEQLTPREREVLQLMAEGRQNAEIAKVLNVSVKTVETHKAHILEKLQTHDREKLLAYAMRLGLIPPPSDSG